MINNNTYRLDLSEELGVNTTFNISDLIPFASGVDIEEEEQEGLKTGLCCCLLGSKFSRFLDRDLRGVGDDATAAIGKVGVL